MSDSSEISIEIFWEVLKRHFEKASSTDADKNELVLALDDFKDVEQLLQEVVYECSEEKRVETVPFLAKITEFITDHSWEIGASMTWADFRKLVEHVEPWKISEELPLEDIKDSKTDHILNFWDNLQQCFQDVSTIVTGSDEATVSLSDTKEVERLMQVAINATSSNTNLKQLAIVDQIIQFIEKQPWDHNVNVTWTDFKKLVDYIEPWKVLEQSPSTSTGFAENSSQSWVPLFAPNTFAEDVETDRRKRVLALADKEDAERAAKAMKLELAQLSKNSPEDTLLEEDFALEPDKMAVDCYYKHLRTIVIGEPTPNNTATVSSRVVNVTAAEGTCAVTSESATCVALNNLIAGGSFFKTPTDIVPQPCKYFSSFQITTDVVEQTTINFQGALVWCDVSPKAVKSAAQQVANAILIDLSGPILVQAWSELAGQFCNLWNEIEAARAEGKKYAKGNIIDLQRVRVTALANNPWHGSSLTNIRVLSTVAVQNQPKLGTSAQILTQASQPNMLTAKFPVLPAHCCIKTFSGYKEKFLAPFRATCMGVVADVKPVDVSQNGNRKCIFNLVDEEGSYFQCCAMYQHCDHQMLVEGQDLIIYYGTGRGPLGSMPGMLYMMNDAFILPNGSKPRAENMRPIKKQEISIRDR